MEGFSRAFNLLVLAINESILLIHLASHVGFGGAFLLPLSVALFDFSSTDVSNCIRMYICLNLILFFTCARNTLNLKYEKFREIVNFIGVCSGTSKMSTSCLVGFCATLVDSCCWNPCIRISLSCCDSKISALPFWCRHKISETWAKCESQ